MGDARRFYTKKKKPPTPGKEQSRSGGHDGEVLLAQDPRREIQDPDPL
jgi:hypothetical protein